MFTLGDRVRVKPDLVVKESYNGIMMLDGMAGYRGKGFFIRDIDDLINPSCYRLAGCVTDGYYWWWDESMLERVPFFSLNYWLSELERLFAVVDGELEERIGAIPV